MPEIGVELVYFDICPYNEVAAGKGASPGAQEYPQISEYDGLVSLRAFLTHVQSVTESRGLGSYYSVERRLHNEAQDILENLTFIGEKELAEAAKGLAAYYKNFLDQNPENQLCILTEVDAHHRINEVKSDEFVLEKILEQFSDEDIAKYKGRILSRIDEITSDPANVKVVMLDDWSISGVQLKDEYKRLLEDPAFRKYQESLEIDLVVASKEQIEDGLAVKEEHSDEHGNLGQLRPSIPIRSYFLAHVSESAIFNLGAAITGTHSSVDHNFERPLHEMADYIDSIKSEDTPSTQLPPLANIVRPYRNINLPRVEQLKAAKKVVLET